MFTRTLRIVLTMLFLANPLVARAATATEQWNDFKTRFISPDGRVIDWQNQQQSHSEGQGYGMLLAVLTQDQKAFDLIFNWSENNLGTGLRAWTWGEKDGLWNVLDPNNATDGDILHAWSLLLAGELWHNEAYTKAGRTILDLIRKELIASDYTILPARKGFVSQGTTRANPSYAIFPALRDFAKFDPGQARLWNNVYARSLSLIEESSDPHTGLIPDWITLNVKGKLQPPASPEFFGFEAIRVPLYLAMAGESQALKRLESIIEHAVQVQFLPDVIKLTGERASDHEALAGGYAAFARASAAMGMKEAADTLWKLARKRLAEQKDSYYGTVLYLLALLG